MGAALLDPPKVLKGNPGVLVVDPEIKNTEMNGLANLIAEMPDYVQNFWKAPPKASQAGSCPCGCGAVVPLAWATPEALAVRKQKALEWVNALRTEWGHPALPELPKGRIGKAMDCVVARALPGSVSVRSMVTTFGDLRASVQIPVDVKWFIEAFDKGYYPELVA